MPDKIDTICLVTYPRSGSTLLRNIINSSSDTYIHAENLGCILNLVDFSINLQSVNSFIKYSNNGELTSEKSFDIDLDINEVRSDIKNILYKNILNSKHKKIGWTEFGISPMSISDIKCNNYLDEIKKIFKNCLLIFNIRNPIDVSKSGPWKSAPSSALMIEKNNDFYTEYVDKNKNNSILINFNEWISDKNYLFNILNQYNFEIDYDKYLLSFDNQLDHLKDW